MSASEFRVSDAHRYDYASPLRWVLSHLLRYPWFPVGGVLLVLVANVLNARAPLLIGQALDEISAPSVDTSQVLGLALMILAVRLGQSVFGMLGIWSLDISGQRLERDSRDELFLSLLGKSQSFHDRQRVGDVMARATNDVRQLNAAMNPGLSLIFDSMLSLIVPIVAIGMLRSELLLVPLGFTVAFFFAVRSYSRQLNPVTVKLRERFGEMNTTLEESVEGIEVVKAFAQEAQEQRRFATQVRAFRDLFVEQGRIQARYLPLLVFAVSYGLAFVHALLLYTAGRLSVGEVVAFMGLMGALRFPTFISIFTFSLVQLGLAAAARILALILAKSDLDENEAGVARTVEGEVIFDHVTLELGGTPVLRDVTFTARPGETIAIVGQTGSGKTTLTRLINRIYEASGGRILIDGVDVRDWSLESLRSQVSTIEQDVFLFSRSVAENIGFGARGEATREEVERAAEEAQAAEFIVELSEGYETVIGERGVTLSGGQRQRLAIARALLTKPRILILDDSTSAIDSSTEDRIQRAIWRVLAGRTTFIITHRLSQIRWADRIVVLRRGEVLDQGTHDELLGRCAAYRDIFAQFEVAAPEMARVR